VVYVNIPYVIHCCAKTDVIFSGKVSLFLFLWPGYTALRSLLAKLQLHLGPTDKYSGDHYVLLVSYAFFKFLHT